MDKLNLVVTLTYHKSTPGTHVFQNVEKGVAVRSLYINRDAFGGFEGQPQPGEKVRITVESVA